MDEQTWYEIEVEESKAPAVKSASYDPVQRFFIVVRKDENIIDAAFRVLWRETTDILINNFWFAERMAAIDNLPRFVGFLKDKGYKIAGYPIVPNPEERENVLNTILETAVPMFSIQNRFCVLSIKKSTSCEGCRYKEPGQRAHMGRGGCLDIFE